MTHVASARTESTAAGYPLSLVQSTEPLTFVAGIDGVPAEVDNDELLAWVAEVAAMTQPAQIHWCDGSEEEWTAITDGMVDAGTLIRLNPELRPNSFLARSDAADVARVEDRTFICSKTEADAGPTNNWREPTAMKNTLVELFTGSMRGRTMYVVPFSMGPLGGPISQLGVQITDSPYAVINLRIMAKIGLEPLRQIHQDTEWVSALHGVGHPLIDDEGNAVPELTWPSNDTKYITHFPESREIWSYGSGYGGNALLSKKCFALRIGSAMGRDEGWLAEHMLVLKLTSPAGRNYHIVAAFPSACGKTNLAMMAPTVPGWTSQTIGDDIAWLRPGSDGRLWAINPEAGFFGVAPGTSPETNPVALATMEANTVFTNVALTDDGDVWWEGLTPEAPQHLLDWEGNDWTPESGTLAAHPNSRFTVPIEQCPTMAPEWYAPEGVPIDAIVFGGRRASNVPLVAEAYDWQHGVFLGATVASEQTAAAEGPVGELRRDPFAMLPFCGYNMADYWSHWLDMGRRLGEKAPRIYQVNWFRKGPDGRYLWPGFGENSRVLEWIARRVDGLTDAVDAPTGRVPGDGLNLDGLEVAAEDLAEMFRVDRESWEIESDLTEEYFEQFGDAMPDELLDELKSLRNRLSKI